MRLTVLVACMALVGANGSAFAQGAGGGVLAGVNIANVKVDVGGASVNFDSRTGLIAGVFGVVPVRGHFAIEPGVFFSTQGAKISIDDELFGGSGTIKLTYLQVPVLARMTAPLGPSAGLRLFAGPSFGFRLSAKGRGDDETSDTDIKEDIEPLDFGAVIGAGIEVRHFLVDARYTLGLRDILKDGSDGESMKNRVFSVMAGVRF